jgi:hypothetical protein
MEDICMGYERTYQAIPEDWEPLKVAVSAGLYSEFMTFIPFYLSQDYDAWLKGRENGPAFVGELKRLVAERPGIEKRMLDLDRRFDMLHYLLSQERRQRVAEAHDLGTKAICGSTLLPSHLAGTQGHLTGYSTPLEVLEIALFLESLTMSDLLDHFTPSDMLDKGVYKIYQWREDEHEYLLNLLREDYDMLRAFYHSVAENEEAVLAVCQ